MSIKIDNGYIIPKLKIDELFKFNKRVQLAMQPIAEARYNKLFSTHLIEKIDDIAIKANGCDIIFDKEYKGNNLYMGLWLSYHNRLKEMITNNQRDPELDFETTATYFPLRGKILVWFNTEQTELRSLWRHTFEEIKDYAYYTHSDKPSDVTPKQWKKRLQDWELAFGNDLTQRATQIGLNYTLVNNDIVGLPRYEIILENIPDFDERLTRLAANDYYDRYLLDKTKDWSREEKKSHEFISVFFEAQDNVKNGLVDDEIQELKNKFKSLIVKDFTEEILKDKLILK